MANHAVFISYDHSEDVHYKRLLEAWDVILILIFNSKIIVFVNQLIVHMLSN
jgi:hypothetical protein